MASIFARRMVLLAGLLQVLFCTCQGLANGPFEKATHLLRSYCVGCHGKDLAEAQVDLESIAVDPMMATQFRQWRKVIRMLEQRKMPPAQADQPGDRERQQLISTIRKNLHETAKLRASDPGDVIIRRLTAAEYGYTVLDLTGLDLKFSDFVSDAVGGEGFTNIGNVQFMQDSTMERYLNGAKKVADHAVIGSGPLFFYEVPGKTGFELSAITRIQNTYRANGFRTSAGEGGEGFGMERYARAFFTAWLYRYRRELGRDEVTLDLLAEEQDVSPRFARYIWSVVTAGNSSFPTSDIVRRWKELSVPDRNQEGDLDKVRAECVEIHQLLTDWQYRFAQNADDKEQAPTLNASSFQFATTQQFEMNVNWPEGTKASHLRIQVESANGAIQRGVTIMWRKPRIQFRDPDQQLEDPKPLEQVLNEHDIRRLEFGYHPEGRVIDSDDFVTTGTTLTAFAIPIPAGARSAGLTITAELDVTHSPDGIVRCTISQEEETDQGKQVSALLANPESERIREWRAGVLDFARTLPQVSHREPAPSDRDPIPYPFDNTYNNPIRNEYHYKVKYNRDDSFLVKHMIGPAIRQSLDYAWTDLLGSFEYHDAYLRLIAKALTVDLGEGRIADLSPSWISQLPADVRPEVRKLQNSFREIRQTFQDSQSRHLEDVLQFAHRAWRRPLSEGEQDQLRSFYNGLKSAGKHDHVQSIRGVLARILTAPQFLYRAERPVLNQEQAVTSGKDISEVVVALGDWELASRLSYFLWSSLPDEPLRKAASGGELSRPESLVNQVDRMLQDPKARRLAAEFFGQWFGFYQFDRYRGVDPKRFPEFTDSLKASMYDEAVSFFEHLIRNNRPVSDILFANYSFLNRQLAAHYGIDQGPLSDTTQRVENLESYNRGGLLGLGAVLTVTSAPLRTSPVKRGDWILRRVLGTPVPPPPADAGSIPADDLLNDGLTVRDRLESHRQNISCRNCHARIDPLGFALEHFNAIGARRETYRDKQMIETSGTLSDGTVIEDEPGLRRYLRKQERLFQRTLCRKLVGFSLGRRESIADLLLIERMLDDIKNRGRFSDLVKTIVASPQFRYSKVATAKPE